MNLYLRLLWLRIASTLRPRISAFDVAKTPFRVAPTDLDVLAHMNNGKYLSILDLGRLDLMLRSGLWTTIRKREWYPVVAGQSITYLKPLTLFRRFEVRTQLVGFHGRWVYVRQSFWSGKTVHAHAIIRAVFLKRSGGTVDYEELVETIGEQVRDLPLERWIIDWSENTKYPA